MINGKYPKFLLGLTTTSGSDWRGKIEEAKRFGITEVALFATAMDYTKRQELYKLIESSPIKRIPHVHLRHDFELEEIDYLSERYGTHLFNLHADENGKKAFLKYKKYQSQIYFENQSEISDLFRELIELSAGICVDFSHWKDYSKYPSYNNFSSLFNKHKIGCCHISAIRKTPVLDPGDQTKHYACHTAEDKHDFDYMKEFIDYLPEYCSIEIENSFEEQLIFKKHLENLSHNTTTE